MTSLFKKSAAEAEAAAAEPKVKAPRKSKAAAEPKVKEPKAPKALPTQADLDAAIAQWDQLKAEAKTSSPIPTELAKQLTKARRTVRSIKKALGIFVPVADRPKAEKPVKVSKKAKKEAAADEASASEE